MAQFASAHRWCAAAGLGSMDRSTKSGRTFHREHDVSRSSAIPSLAGFAAIAIARRNGLRCRQRGIHACLVSHKGHKERPGTGVSNPRLTDGETQNKEVESRWLRVGGEGKTGSHAFPRERRILYYGIV